MASSKRSKTSRPSATPLRKRVPQARASAPETPGVSVTDLLVTQQQLAEAISLAIQKGRSLDAMSYGCLRVFLDRTGAQRGSVYLEDEQTREMRVLATCGDVLGKGTMRIVEPMVTRVMREGRGQAAADCLAAPLKR
ncbi:MAG: hypothetical protein ACREI9_13990, partial [Nitrospiraceae bacterium]